MPALRPSPLLLAALACFGLAACSVRLSPGDAAAYFLRVSAQEALLPGQEGPLLLEVAQPGGAPLGAVQVVHEKPFHVFLASTDLKHFAHVHPDVDPSQAAFGPLSVRFTPGQGGPHRAWVEFTPQGAPTQVVDSAFQVAGDAPSTSALVLDDLSQAKQLDGLQVFLAKEAQALTFTLRDAQGQPPKLSPYLGADGHAIAIREGGLQLVHIHPDGPAVAGQLRFQAHFPLAGRYKVWGEFMPEGRFVRTAFVVEVPAADAVGTASPAAHTDHAH